MEEKTASFEEKSGQDQALMAETTWKKMVSKLLANKQAVIPLLVYLKNLEVGSRERVVGVTSEWRRKSNPKKKEQLGNP